MKYDKKYQEALKEWSVALFKIAELCEDGEQGKQFNDFIADKLGKCIPFSVDEMAHEIMGVVDDMKAE